MVPIPSRPNRNTTNSLFFTRTTTINNNNKINIFLLQANGTHRLRSPFPISTLPRNTFMQG